MQVGTENSRYLPNWGSAVPGTVDLTQEGSDNSVRLSDADMSLFRALRKVNAPKQRICSALWLSYAEYDELSKRL